LLEDLPRGLHSPWVFPGTSKDAPREDLKRSWDRVRKGAKIPDVTIHDLRRTTGSWLVQRGVPLKVIGAALGHRDTRSTEVYARIAAQQPAEALDMLGDALSGLVKPRRGRKGGAA
jgi:integrase